jgi:hypothetical protein
MGVTKGGAVIVNVSVADAEIAARIKQLLATAGGELTQDGFGSPLMGAYGPTTAHGRRGVIGGQPATSAMANQTFQDALGRGASAELTIGEREREAAAPTPPPAR